VASSVSPRGYISENRTVRWRNLARRMLMIDPHIPATVIDNEPLNPDQSLPLISLNGQTLGTDGRLQ
jgi:hypothetical protein